MDRPPPELANHAEDFAHRWRDKLIDSIIAHEWAEDKTLDHGEALKAAARTEQPVSPTFAGKN
jgi:hypothetical protein